MSLKRTTMAGASLFSISLSLSPERPLCVSCKDGRLRCSVCPACKGLMFSLVMWWNVNAGLWKNIDCASIEFVIRGRGIAVFEFSIHAFGFDTPLSFHVARSSAVCFVELKERPKPYICFEFLYHSWKLSEFIQCVVHVHVGMLIKAWQGRLAFDSQSIEVHPCTQRTSWKLSYQIKGATKSLVISLIFSHTNNILGDKFGGNLCSPTTVS